MEAMEIFLATSRDLSYVALNHPLYSIIGFFVAFCALLRFYCRLTLGVCESDQDLTGKTVLITGGTAGIGKATAFDLARRHARVLVACRNLQKGDRVVQEIKATTGNQNVVVKHLDLSSFASVRKCAEDVLKTEDELHILINNAGTLEKSEKLTEDGWEAILQANHLSHFLLTLLLLDLLKKSAPSRIINVSSAAYVYGRVDPEDLNADRNSSAMTLYFNSKLANILFTTELASRLAGTGVTVNAAHPGMVKTDILKTVNNLFVLATNFLMALLGKSCEEGAQTTIYLAVEPALEKVTGKYFGDCKEEKLAAKALDRAVARRLFEVSEKIVGASMPH